MAPAESQIGTESRFGSRHLVSLPRAIALRHQSHLLRRNPCRSRQTSRPARAPRRFWIERRPSALPASLVPVQFRSERAGYVTLDRPWGNAAPRPVASRWPAFVSAVAASVSTTSMPSRIAWASGSNVDCRGWLRFPPPQSPAAEEAVHLATEVSRLERMFAESTSSSRSDRPLQSRLGRGHPSRSRVGERDERPICDVQPHRRHVDVCRQARLAVPPRQMFLR